MGGNPMDLSVAWAIAEFETGSKNLELAEYPCSVDFSKIDDYVVGKVGGKIVTFKEYMKDFSFYDEEQTLSDVYDFIYGASIDMDKYIGVLKESGVYNKDDLERRCEKHRATLKALEFIREEIVDNWQ